MIALGVVLPLALLATWQLVSMSGIVAAYRFPSPTTVVLAGVDLAQRGLLFQYVGISVQRVLIGFAIGSIVGLVLGSVVGLSRIASALLAPTIGGFRAVPSLAWVPLLILYVGINEDSKVTLIAIGALFPVYTTVAGALRHVDPHLVELGHAYGLGRMSLLQRVQLPAVIPSIVSGLRLALAQSWLFLVAAELIASSMGLGYPAGGVAEQRARRSDVPDDHPARHPRQDDGCADRARGARSAQALGVAPTAARRRRELTAAAPASSSRHATAIHRTPSAGAAPVLGSTACGCGVVML